MTHLYLRQYLFDGKESVAYQYNKFPVIRKDIRVRASISNALFDDWYLGVTEHVSLTLDLEIEKTT